MKPAIIEPTWGDMLEFNRYQVFCRREFSNYSLILLIMPKNSATLIFFGSSRKVAVSLSTAIGIIAPTLMLSV